MDRCLPCEMAALVAKGARQHRLSARRKRLPLIFLPPASVCVWEIVQYVFRAIHFF